MEKKEEMRDMLNQVDVYTRDRQGYSQSMVIVDQKRDPTILQSPVRDKKEDPNFTCTKGTSPLLWATLYGSVRSMEVLIDAKADVDFVNNYHDTRCTALFLAAKMGSHEKVKLLVEAKAALHVMNQGCTNAMDIAQERGHSDIVKVLRGAKAMQNEMWECMYPACAEGRADDVKRLLDAGYPLYLQDNRGQQPLLLATRHGHTDIMQMLIAARAQVNVTDGSDKNPINHAIMQGRLEHTQLLIDAQADVNVNIGCKPIICSVQQGNIDITKVLINSRAEVNVKDVSGNAPLHYSIMQGRIDLTKLLIDAQAMINIPDARFTAPIWLSIKQGNLEVTELLLEAKARVDTRHAEIPPLIYSAQKNNIDLAKLLIKARAHVNVCDKRSTPLIYSIEHGNLEFAKLLIDSQADVNLRPETTATTALYCATEGNDINAAKMLIDAKADLNRLVGNRTPLAYAAENEQLGMMTLLLHAKATVDAGDGLALSCATRSGNTKAVRILLEAKASLEIRDCSNETPLLIAISKGNRRIVSMLVAAKAALVSPRDGDDPLTVAVKFGNTDIMKILIDVEVPLEAAAVKPSPLLIAIENHNIPAMQILLEAKAATDIPGTTYAKDLLSRALDIVMKSQSDDVLRLLLDANPSLALNRESTKFLGPLYKKKRFSTLQLLLERNASVYGATVDNVSILHRGVLDHRTHLVKLMIDAKAPLEFRTLSAAVQGRQLAVVKMLVEAKADLRVRDRRGVSLLLAALENKSTSIVKILLNADPALVEECNSHGMTSLMLAVLKYPEPQDARILMMLLEHARVHCAARSDDEPPPKRFKGKK